MESDVLAVAGAIAGFFAAVFSIVDKLLSWAERAKALRRPTVPDAVHSDTEEEEDDEDTDDVAAPKPKPRGRRRRWWTIHWPAWLGPAPTYLIPNELAVACGAGILLNSLGLLLSIRLESILFLDMVGTAFTAILLGPWWGAATALLTNSLVNWVLNPQSNPELLIFPWTLVNMAGGFYWGMLARTGLFRRYLKSGHTSVLSHVVFLLAFGAAGAGIMSIPGVAVQQVVSQSTTMTLNAAVADALQDVVAQGEAWFEEFFGDVSTSDWAARLGGLLLAWVHTCLLYIPDKVVSVAIALILVKQGFPIFEEELVMGRDGAEPPTDNRLAPLVLGLLYVPTFSILISSEPYLGNTYWPLWSAPWLAMAGGYTWLSRRAPDEEDLRAARIDRAARYRDELRPLHRQPVSSFGQRLTVGWLMASALFALFMPVMLNDYSKVAFNFFCVVYGAMLALHLIRVSIAQNIASARNAASDEDALPARGRRRSRAA